MLALCKVYLLGIRSCNHSDTRNIIRARGQQVSVYVVVSSINKTGSAVKIKPDVGNMESNGLFSRRERDGLTLQSKGHRLDRIHEHRLAREIDGIQKSRVVELY